MLATTISDQKTSWIKKLRIAEIHYHKKIQIDILQIDRVIHDLEILLVKKNLVIFSKSFGMVQIGYIPILVAIGPSVQIIDANNATQQTLHIPFRSRLSDRHFFPNDK